MTLTLADLVRHLLMGAFAVVVFAAILSRYLHARTERRGIARRCVCRLCLHAFEDSSRDSIIRCPACNARNAKAHPHLPG